MNYLLKKNIKNKIDVLFSSPIIILLKMAHNILLIKKILKQAKRGNQTDN